MLAQSCCLDKLCEGLQAEPKYFLAQGMPTLPSNKRVFPDVGQIVACVVRHQILSLEGKAYLLESPLMHACAFAQIKQLCSR